MTWPGLGKCTAYPRPGQDSPPLGVRWFSDGLGGAGGRGWEERGATVDETGLEVEKRKRESACAAACGLAAKRGNGGGLWGANRTASRSQTASARERKDNKGRAPRLVFG